jgi:transcriptional regulator with XRE-family HTH domain
MSVEFREQVAETIKRYRERVGLSQEGLASRIGMSRLTVLRWEGARLDITYVQWCRVAETLAIPMPEWPVWPSSSTAAESA